MYNGHIKPSDARQTMRYARWKHVIRPGTLESNMLIYRKINIPYQYLFYTRIRLKYKYILFFS